ncbi:MAG: hypothetical protein ACPGUV_00080 [Polyangiales bacterium]
MFGIWVGLSRSVTEAAVSELLGRWFPAVVHLTHAAALASTAASWPAIVFSVEMRPEVPDFPARVHFDCFPGPEAHAIAVGIALAQKFAAALGCDSVTDGSGYGDDASPYWSIVWHGGRAYLADDSDSAFADNTSRPLRRVRPLDITAVKLNEDGLWVPDRG